MKKDLATVIIAAITGFVVAYLTTNLIYPALESVQVKTLDQTVNSAIDLPSEDVFNFRSINPTVEVYVGQCKEYNANGDCIDTQTEPEAESTDEDQSTEPVEESGDGNSY